MFGGTRGNETSWDPFLSLLSAKKTPMVRKGALHHSDVSPHPTVGDDTPSSTPIHISSLSSSTELPKTTKSSTPPTTTSSSPSSSSLSTSVTLVNHHPISPPPRPPRNFPATTSSTSLQPTPPSSVLHCFPSSSSDAHRPPALVVDEIVPILFAAEPLEKSKINEFNTAMRSSEGRARFGRALNIQRVNGMCVAKTTFEQLSELLRMALTEADVQDDYRTGKSLMHMGSTFYRTLDGVHEHLSSRLKNLEIWKKIRFWEEALYETLLDERERCAPKDWLDMTVEEQQDQILRDRNTIFGLLGSFSYNMLSYGVVDATVKKFIECQCKINLLANEQKQMLLVNMQTMSLSLREVETIITQKLQKEANKRKKWEASKRKQERFRAARDKLGTMGIAIGSPTERGKGEFSVHRRKQQLMQQIVEHKRISKRLSMKGGAFGLAPGKSVIATASAISGTSPLRKTWEKAENTQMYRKAALMGSYKPRGGEHGSLLRYEKKERENEKSPENKTAPHSRIGEVAVEVLSALAPATEKLAKFAAGDNFDWLSSPASYFLRSSAEGGSGGEEENSSLPSPSSSLLEHQAAGLSLLARPISPSSLSSSISPSSSATSSSLLLLDPEEKISPEVAAAAVTMKAQINILTARILGTDQPFQHLDEEEEEDDDEYDEEGGEDDSDSYFYDDFEDMDYEENEMEGYVSGSTSGSGLKAGPGIERGSPSSPSSRSGSRIGESGEKEKEKEKEKEVSPIGSLVDPSKIVEWIIPIVSSVPSSSPSSSPPVSSPLVSPFATSTKSSRRGQQQSASMYSESTTFFPSLSMFSTPSSTSSSSSASPAPTSSTTDALTLPSLVSPRRPTSGPDSAPTTTTSLKLGPNWASSASPSHSINTSPSPTGERSFTNPPQVDRSQLGMTSLWKTPVFHHHNQTTGMTSANSSKWTAAGATHLHPQVGLLGAKQRWQPSSSSTSSSPASSGSDSIEASTSSVASSGSSSNSGSGEHQWCGGQVGREDEEEISDLLEA